MKTARAPPSPRWRLRACCSPSPAAAASAVTGDEPSRPRRAGERRAGRRHGRARHARVVPRCPRSCCGTFEEESGYDLEVRAAGDAGTLTTKLVADQGQPDRRRRLRRRQHVRLARARGGRVRRRTTPPAAGRRAVRRSTDGGERLDPGRRRQRLRQRRHTWFAERDLARRRPSTTSPTRPTRDLFVTPGAVDQLAGPGVPAHHRRGVRRRRLAGLLEGPARQRRPGRRRLDGRLRRRLHPGRRRAATGRSCCPTTPRRRSPSEGGDESTTARAARHLLPPGRVRRRARRRREPEGAEALVDFLLAREVQAALPTSMYVFPVERRRRAARRLGASSPSSPPTRYGSTRPRSPRNRDAWLSEWTRPGQPGEPRRPAGLARAGRSAAGRWCSASSSCCPWPAWSRAGFWPTASSTPAAVLEVLARPRVHRVRGSRVWSAAVGHGGRGAARAAGGVRAAPAGAPGRRLLRAALLVPFVLPTVVVGVAFRAAARRGRAARGSSASTAPPVAIVAGLVFFNVAVVIRAVGAAWESLDPRPGEAAAALGATPWQVLRTVTLPALRPAIVSAASVVFLFCATAFGDRAHPRRHPLRDGRDRDLPAHHAAVRPAGRGRALDPAARRGGRRCSWSPPGCGPSPDARPPGRAPARAAPARRRARARARPRCCSPRSRCRSARWSPGRCGSTAAGAWPTTARLSTDGRATGAAGAGRPTPWSPRCAPRSTRPGWRC